MPTLVIIAKITAAEGHCIQYDFHQDLKNPHLFYAYEQWETMAHLQAHGKSAHISAMKANTKGIILSSELSFLNKI